MRGYFLHLWGVDFRLPIFCAENLTSTRRQQNGKGEANMDIYTYMFFTYGLTAVISLFMAGLIVIVNRLTSRI